MGQSLSRRQLPVIAVACLIVFLSYVLFTTGYQSLTCERVAPGGVQCESVDNYLFGLVARPRAAFPLEEVEVDSDPRDRNPRGGVRFHHTIILNGENHSFSSDPFRSPLSQMAIRKQIQAFMQGEGPAVLNFQRSTQVLALVRSDLLAALLGIVAWGFWDVRWPLSSPSAPPEDEPT